MKKRILSIFLTLAVLVSSLFAFTGCNLYHDNNKRLNSEVVAKVGDEEITRSDITTWFNYYYYSCNMYYQYSAEDVYKLSLNNLVKFKIIINEAKHNKDITITISDQNKIWEQVFDYIDDSVDTYEKEIKKRYGIKTDDEETKDDEEDPIVYAPYKRSEIKYAIDYDQNDTVLKNVYNAPKAEDNYYRYLAYQKYVAEIAKSANLYSKKKLSNEEALKEELQRYYTYYEERTYVKKYNDYCLKNLDVSDEAIVNKYIEALNSQIQNFAIYDNYTATISSSSNKDLIVFNQLGGGFSVQQIVLEFNDMVKTTYNDSEIKISEFLTSFINSGFVIEESDATTEEQKEYIKAREDYAYNGSSLNMTYIDPDTGLTKDEDGNEIKKTYADFLSELNAITTAYSDAVTASLSIVDPTEQAAAKEKANRDYVQAFYKLKFSYSKDSGVTDLTSLFNKMGYVFPENKEDNVNSWVSEFTDAAYELYDNYKTTGNFSTKIFVSNYGVHVMIFSGVIDAGPIAEKNIDSLKNTYFSYATDQTVADYYYDAILSELQTGANTYSNHYLQAMLGSEVSSVLYEKVSSILYNEYSVSGKIDIKYPEYDDIAQ